MFVNNDGSSWQDTAWLQPWSVAILPYLDEVNLASALVKEGGVAGANQSVTGISQLETKISVYICPSTPGERGPVTQTFPGGLEMEGFPIAADLNHRSGVLDYYEVDPICWTTFRPS